jgi:hypothetical protein
LIVVSDDQVDRQEISACAHAFQYIGLLQGLAMLSRLSGWASGGLAVLGTGEDPRDALKSHRRILPPTSRDNK